MIFNLWKAAETWISPVDGKPLLRVTTESQLFKNCLRIVEGARAPPLLACPLCPGMDLAPPLALHCASFTPLPFDCAQRAGLATSRG